MSKSHHYSLLAHNTHTWIMHTCCIIIKRLTKHHSTHAHFTYPPPYYYCTPHMRMHTHTHSTLTLPHFPHARTQTTHTCAMITTKNTHQTQFSQQKHTQHTQDSQQKHARHTTTNIHNKKNTHVTHATTKRTQQEEQAQHTRNRSTATENSTSTKLYGEGLHEGPWTMSTAGLTPHAPIKLSAQLPNAARPGARHPPPQRRQLVGVAARHGTRRGWYSEGPGARMHPRAGRARPSPCVSRPPSAPPYASHPAARNCLIYPLPPTRDPAEHVCWSVRGYISRRLPVPMRCMIGSHGPSG